ncbi:hypothetical protein UY3_14882 [Chelonia mydas]|uniref:Uncharacterized protein n=1 Tax=Chelonia mydas TaxID=8469 RepID=M7ARQ8_CHEMY|nr:hypothetical protein UY3_14882 [Chelonia mydas]
MPLCSALATSDGQALSKAMIAADSYENRQQTIEQTVFGSDGKSMASNMTDSTILTRGSSTNFATRSSRRRIATAAKAAELRPQTTQAGRSCRRIAAEGHGLLPHSKSCPKHLLGKLVPGADPDPYSY